MTVRFFDAERAYAVQRDELRAAFDAVMTSGRLILGPQVEGFERELANAVGSQFAVGVASGTDAVELALRALELPPGSEVLCPNLTALATPTAIVRAGHIPVLVDVHEETLVIDPEQAHAAVSRATRAVVAVHLYGRAAPIEELARIGLPVVEDAAQAHGLDLGSRRAGSAGLLGCFSFYPTKNLGAFGDGGAVTTSDADLAARVRELRAYGERPRHFARVAGTNSRLDELQAALLRVRLRRLDDDNRRRAEVAASYDVAFRHSSPYGVHHLYVVRPPSRAEFRARLAEVGIETAIHYPWGIGEQPAFASARRHGELEVSTRAAREVVSLPCYAHLSSDEEAVVAEQLSVLAGRPQFALPRKQER